MNLASAVWIADIGRSLRAAFFMFWVTLWPLILGFGLSGAVQAFISRDAMQRRLGDHRPPAVTRASVYGMVSSSCSYAASALSKSLFVKGADFIAANVSCLPPPTWSSSSASSLPSSWAGSSPPASSSAGSS